MATPTCKPTSALIAGPNDAAALYMWLRPTWFQDLGNQHRVRRRSAAHATTWFLDACSVSFRVAFPILLDLFMFEGYRQRLCSLCSRYDFDVFFNKFWSHSCHRWFSKLFDLFSRPAQKCEICVSSAPARPDWRADPPAELTHTHQEKRLADQHTYKTIFF